MSFGSWWVSFRNSVESVIESAVKAELPAIQVALVNAGGAAIAAAAATSGSSGDKFVAGRNAAETVLKAQGATIGTDLLHAVVGGAIASQQPPAGS